MNERGIIDLNPRGVIPPNYYKKRRK